MLRREELKHKRVGSTVMRLIMGWGGAFCYGSGEPCVLAKFTRCLKCSPLPSPHNHPDVFYKFAHLTRLPYIFWTALFLRFQSEETLENNRAHIKQPTRVSEFGISF